MSNNDELDLSTVFFTHEIEGGLNPEVNPGLWTRLLVDSSDCE
jgi:hypothetical protein